MNPVADTDSTAEILLLKRQARILVIEMQNDSLIHKTELND